jgi:hypothetical protein
MDNTEDVEFIDFFEKPYDIRYILTVEINGEELFSDHTSDSSSAKRMIEHGAELAQEFINDEVTPWSN